jgi:hypothetical protein
MGERIATVIIADDMTTSFNGKLNLRGIYTQDIAIPMTPLRAPQLIFVFHIEFDVDDLVKKFDIEVEFPGSTHHRSEIIVPSPTPSTGRTRHVLSFTIPFVNIELNLGKIHAKVIHDKGTIDVSVPWIVEYVQRT